MSIQKFDIQPLFAIPYFRADLSHAISEEQVAFIQNLKMVPNKQNLISENLYIFEEPELKSIKDAVQEALDMYASTVMGLSNQRLYVTQSWSLINEPGVGMHPHSHSNSFVSGSLYYADLPQPSSRMIFDRHTTYQQLKVTPDADKNNLYNTPVNVITPASKEVLLFSSDLNHQVEANQTEKPRYSIAFNCWIRGTIGDHRDVSALVMD